MKYVLQRAGVLQGELFVVAVLAVGIAALLPRFARLGRGRCRWWGRGDVSGDVSGDVAAARLVHVGVLAHAPIAAVTGDAAPLALEYAVDAYGDVATPAVVMGNEVVGAAAAGDIDVVEEVGIYASGLVGVAEDDRDAVGVGRLRALGELGDGGDGMRERDGAAEARGERQARQVARAVEGE